MDCENCMINSIRYYLELNSCKRKWRRLNKHNETNMKMICSCNIVSVGKKTYGNLYVHSSNSINKLHIGSYCSIAENVMFLLSSEHNTSTVSTYPFQTKLVNSQQEGVSKGDIIVDDDVWIGYGATIMSGVHIGQGAVVAAGAVVTKDVPPYTIVGGVPAKVIKYRFEPKMIEELLKIDYSKLTKEDIEKHIDDLYTELKDPRQLDWMPRKG